MQATNPYSTGAGGPDFERRVATSFICSALVGVTSPPMFSPAQTIRLQAGHLQCGLEDLVLESQVGGKGQQRLFVSVKSTIKPRTSDREFSEVISKAWKDWQAGTSFNKETDSFLVAAAVSRSPQIHFLGRLTETARASADASDFNNRLSQEGYIQSAVRDLLPEIIGVIEAASQATPGSDNLTAFLRRLFVTTFDFDQEASQDKSRVLGLLKLASESRDVSAAESCWNAVFERTSLETGKAKVFNSAELSGLSNQYGLRENSPVRTRTWLTNLRAHCRITRSGIVSSLCANQHHLKRQGLLESLLGALSVNQYLLVFGPAGSGKSAIAAEAAETVAKPENVFCFQSEEFGHPHLDAALQAAGLRDLNAEEWSDALPFEPRVLLIDALERLLQSTGSCEALKQLLRVAAADRRWRIVITCRDYLADHIRETWDVPGGWTSIPARLLEDAEFEEAVSGSGIPTLWLAQPAVRGALRNLKWLDLTMRAAQRTTAAIQGSTWATLADWRSFVWRQLLNPELDSSGQELLVRIAVQRATSGLPWSAVDNASSEIADRLCAQGILRKHDLLHDKYRPEHDLLEDWALLFYVRREFAALGQTPIELIAHLGNHLMVRRAFRQFFGELLESKERSVGIFFIRQVFSAASVGKEWREEVVNAMLGSSCALDALQETKEFWTDSSGEGLRSLCHVLRIAYRQKPSENQGTERPLGPGWDALMSFIHAQGDNFLRENTECVVSLLLDWHHAVAPECPAPPGLGAAAALVLGLWRIATEGQEKFEKHWTDDEWRHTSASANRLCWLVASVAGGLDPAFFRAVIREAFSDHTHGSVKADRELHRQCRDLVEFLVTDYRAWPLTRAHPRTMVRLCLKAYGLRKQPDLSRARSFYEGGNCGLTADPHDFSPPSALRGPFLTLIREHRQLGEAFIVRLINEAACRWAQGIRPDDEFNRPFTVSLTIDGKDYIQLADEGWWRCYRGWSPYSHLIECAAMALEQWLLEDVAGREIENLQEVLLRLVRQSNNVAITAVAASVGTVHWWHCGKLAAVLLECFPLLHLDRQRWVNDHRGGVLGGRWPGVPFYYIQERRESNALPHRQEHLESFILKAQLGPGRSDIWKVIDRFNSELGAIPPDKVTDDVQTARLILHRIDSRKLKLLRQKDAPNHILLQPTPPPLELQKHVEESGRKMENAWVPMEMQMWASQILEPMGTGRPEPQRWREMLHKARNLDKSSAEPDRMLVFGNSTVLVAAVCLRDFAPHLNESELEWCISQVSELIAQQSELTPWQPGSMLTSWQAERAAALACGVLLIAQTLKPEQKAAVLDCTAIALTHPEKSVRLAAADGLGRHQTNSNIPLCACELLVLHSRVCRAVDLRHRGPQRLPYEHIQTWGDRCSEMHAEILTETRKLRERFTKGEAPNLGRLALFYPRGHEEEQNLSPILAALLRHRSTTADAILTRVRSWLWIQYIDESKRRFEKRKFAADSWRDHNGYLSRGDPRNYGEVGRLLARRVLSMPPSEVKRFYAPLIRSSRVCHLRGKAGEPLKDLCVMLDLEGDRAAFWAAWDTFVLAAVEVGSHLRDKEHWGRLKIRPEASADCFSALISAIFLNDMYFRRGQRWPHIDGDLDRFTKAFRAFHGFALNDYIEFIGTIGGSSLPGAWRTISDCVEGLIKRTGNSFLTRNSQTHLLRLIAEEVSMHRVPNEDRDTWRAILCLLDALADAGFAEAFRLRESVGRFAT